MIVNHICDDLIKRQTDANQFLYKKCLYNLYYLIIKYNVNIAKIIKLKYKYLLNDYNYMLYNYNINKMCMSNIYKYVIFTWGV